MSNRIADEIISNLGSNELGKFLDEDEFIRHYGVGHDQGGHSGRYPWGSGEDPNQRDGDFYSRYNELKSTGLYSESELAEKMGCKSTTELRRLYSAAKDERRILNVRKANELLESGMNQADVAREMGVNESTLRSWLNAVRAARMNAVGNTVVFLKQQIAEKGMIDVGDGVERDLGISKEKLGTALKLLEQEGYPVYGGGIQQVTNPGKQTNQLVLCAPGTEHKDIYNYENVKTINDYICRVDEDGNDVFERAFEYPASMDSSRLKVVWPAEGGSDKDGLVEIRPGLKDLDLKGSNYSQVRILVDDGYYIKGMAVYNPDLPEGVDIQFNTSKDPATKQMFGDVLKKIKDDPDNPFGALIKPQSQGGQYHYTDENGEKQLGLINKRGDEGDWGDWGNKVPSQMLAKQSMQLITKQLSLTIEDTVNEYNDISNLTNNTVKKELLLKFALECEGAAVDLKAIAFPRQSYQVLFPSGTLKDNEIYAPNYENGEKVAAIRFPHAGTFEIPILTVNNRNPECIKMLGPNPKDAVAISPKVAQQLSGADFDGDCAMIIPCNSDRSSVRITARPPLEALKNFDPHVEYAYKEGMKVLGKQNTQKEMGVISNLITDMTLKGANDEELARAVKHSMVIIDAAKHKLDYKQSEIDNGIAELKRKYQGHLDENGDYHEGAATLISRAKHKEQIEKTKGSGRITEEGELIFKPANEHYIDPKTGKEKLRMQDTTLMAITKDARTISSGTPQEEAYAAYANYMKALAKEARKQYLATPNMKVDPAARKVYAEEVAELDRQLKLAESNAPRERQAQRFANQRIKAKKEDNPNMTSAEKKKIAQQEIVRARTMFGAKRHPIMFTDATWAAVQAGAISATKLRAIMRYADDAEVRRRSSPKNYTNTISEAKQSRIRAMKNQGYTNSEIASMLGVSTTTVNKYGSGSEVE